MDMNFNLILPSNNSTELYPENKASSFTTKLPEDINLNGRWEVALKEIAFPISWYNVENNSGYVTVDFNSVTNPIVLQALNASVFADRLTISIYIEAGYYSSGAQLADEINFRLKASLPRSVGEAITLTYSIPAGRFAIDISHGITVKFSRPLCRMMGLKSSMSSPQMGIRSADLKKGIYSLYVYCDVCEETIVGDAKVKLLRIVPIHGKQGDYVCHTYDFPIYTSVQTKNFNEIRILIADDAGKVVPFRSGKSIVTLHFRRKGFMLA